MTERNKFTVQSLFNQSATLMLPENGIISKVIINGKSLKTCNINHEERELPASIKAGDIIGSPDGSVEYDFTSST
jgi:hypothetical protein